MSRVSRFIHFLKIFKGDFIHFMEIYFCLTNLLNLIRPISELVTLLFRGTLKEDKLCILLGRKVAQRLKDRELNYPNLQSSIRIPRI